VLLCVGQSLNRIAWKARQAARAKFLEKFGNVASAPAPTIKSITAIRKPCLSADTVEKPKHCLRVDFGLTR
jgi:hypothetical protein